MRVVFMGTPEFAVPSLALLLDHGYEVVAVVTQPDRPKGRKKVLTAPPVKQAALLRGLPVLQPERLRAPEAVQQVAAYAPDLIVTAAYGQILPRALLELPRLGCINVHGSLLPHYRGGAPIQRAIMNGETVTGVTIMYMAEGLDTGDMISRVEVPISEADTAGTLFEKLSAAGAQLLGATLPAIINGTASREPQVHAEATYAPNLTREDERIDWTRPARALFNQVRGLSPMAGAFTSLGGEVFKVWACRPASAAPASAAPTRPALASATSGVHPGTLLACDEAGLHVQTGEGVLVLTSIQPAGKRQMDAATWAQGARVAAGTVFGEDGTSSGGDER